MNDYTAILGHEPTERTRKTLDRLEALAQKLREDSPDMTEFEAWSILEEAAEAVIAKRKTREAATN